MNENWKLTEREIEVITLICQGKSNPEIAKELILSRHTIKAHLASIYQKTKTNNRVLLAIKAYNSNLFQMQENNLPLS